MPVYLLHGFRWPRGGLTGIRVHIIIHNLDDCSAEYIQNPQSQAELLRSFRNAYPEIMKELEPSTLGNGKGIQFLEQYDPEDVMGEDVVSQPYAFVADRVVVMAAGPLASVTSDSTTATPTPTSPLSEPATPASARRSSKGSVSAGIAAAAAAKTQALSLNIEEVVAEGPGVMAPAWEAFAQLRDKIAPGEKIGWWVVYNGDPERAYDSDEDEDEDEEDEDEEEDHAEEVEEGTIAAETEDGMLALSQPPPTPPKFPIAVRTRPPQPTPKPRMFEQPDLSHNNNTQPTSPKSPLRSPSSKGSGKRLPGMTALPQQPGHQPGHQQQQQLPAPTKPKIAPKSESLKKKLFGKRS
ncbi:hypothetical protein EPUS_01706 [Endocarpon pusillum Z07020]|uniref:Developmental regulator n=1 Tax=Endocarpon pusillum (strain Z07020 / HMAS-L-300199) TaxID=1263415 RepID=U1GIY9_ENDPU|nr:uncharacterized protein EPUS_01706 [Endocarpon pusillum Z07020]ERF71791.1 hypothetical protein EPUS_01706 [Endocarpon pusillum Z07020]